MANPVFPAPVTPSSDPVLPGLQGGFGALGPPLPSPPEVSPRNDTAAAEAQAFNAATNASFLGAITKTPPAVPRTSDPAASQQATEFQFRTNSSVLSAISNISVPSAGTGFSVRASANGIESVAAQKANAQAQRSAEQTSTFRPEPDWRVRISLAPSARYLYNAAEPGILAPLKGTNGVIFPYTPTISVSYTASYSPNSVTHSNYDIYSYEKSSVSSVSIAGEFTAQDTREANYLLAVIHFFRSCTKMFYGQDNNPTNGTPPPLVYLTGFGAYQFDHHPMVINSFTLSLPDNVDYIRASGANGARAAITQSFSNSPPTSVSVLQRLLGAKLGPGGISPGPQFRNLDASAGGTGAEVTYVPTKIKLAIGAYPMVTRNDVSNNFSLRDYASGKLLRGSQRKGTPTVSGGMW